MKKPRNALEGMQQGGGKFLSGFREGFTDFLEKPIHNIKGVGQKLSGMFVKPLIAIFGSAESTAHGFKNSVMIFGEGPNETRIR